MADLMTPIIDGLLPAAILVTAAIAVVTDVRRRRVYNALTFPAMALGLVANTAAAGPEGLLLALAGLLLGGALFSIPVAMGGRGAGDLKLLAALGALGGPAFVLWCAIYASIAGGVFAVGTLLAKRRLGAVLAPVALDLYVGQMPRATSNIRLPYAIPIAVGAVGALVLR